MHINEYIKNVIKDALPQVKLCEEDTLIECQITIEQVGTDFVLKVRDLEGRDITNLTEVKLSKNDIVEVNGLYTIIKFRMENFL